MSIRRDRFDRELRLESILDEQDEVARGLEETKRIDAQTRALLASLRPGEICPRCGRAKLLRRSPSGKGTAACDECNTYWE
jgi:hypothetical protein